VKATTIRAEVIAIGTELLLGDIVNGNAAWLGRELAAVGVNVDQMTEVGDNRRRIVAAFEVACSRADVVIATGGLGPTQDDITREALAELTGVRVVRDPDLEAALRARFAASGRTEFPTNNLRMADRPEDADILLNPAGTAPGLRVRHGNAVVYALPGVPREMREIFRCHLHDELAAVAGQGTVLLSRQLRTTGIWESEVSHRLADLDAELEAAGNPTIAYLASERGIVVRISAKAGDHASAAAMVDGVDARVRALLGDVVFGVDDDTLEGVVQRLLLDAGATVASAESLTGGLLGAALSTVPGSSAAYHGGVVAYVTAAKTHALGVSSDLLSARGAVDPDVAAAMAAGVRERFGTTYGLATTGVAGPTEQDGKPAGTVYLAVAGPPAGSDAGLRTSVRLVRLSGDRARVRELATQAALDLLRRRLSGLAEDPPPFSIRT
jgi:nicotinamide-nucleotide amidase